jgi:hypothetical protein
LRAVVLFRANQNATETRMPTDTAMEILAAYRAKRRLNPAADKATLFKYILWDRFKGRMIQDSEMDRMAAGAATLAELSLVVIGREKPALVAGRLEQVAREAIRKYYVLNFPDEA